MGFSDVVKGYKPVENSEFGPNKKLVGDAVCESRLEKIVSKKGQEWIILKGKVIHPIADPKGRETTLQSGDEIPIFYSPAEQKDIEELMDDLFTAGISRLG